MTQREDPLRVVCEPTWELLCAQVADVLRVPLADPFAPDMLVVPSRGHQRFLSQALSRSFGPGLDVCAGVDFASMGALRRRVERGVLGLDPRLDPWGGPALVAAALQALELARDEPWGTLLRRHLDGPAGDESARPGRRAADAATIVRLFRRYLARCPQMLLDWDAGTDTWVLDDADAWQPPLWRLLTAMTQPTPHPARRHLLLLDALAAMQTPHPGDDKEEWLPARLGVVTVAPLRPSDRDLIGALARLTPTTLYRWAPLRPSAAPTGLAARYAGVLRDDAAPPPADAPSPLVATSMAPTLLQVVQDDIRHQRSPQAAPSRRADGTVQIHASHGPDRQVEVLREVLCGVLDDDPTLEPRDIVVYCTDLERYAPLIQADFCLAQADPGQSHPGQGLRAQIDQAALRRPNPVLDGLREVLALDRGRATARDLLDLCEKPFVAARFGFSPDDLARLPDIIGASGIVWGIDQAHRERYGLRQIQDGTWFQGTQRLNVAVALTETPTSVLGGIAPAAGVDGADAELIGKLDELIRRVRLCRLRCNDPAPLSVWLTRLRAAIDVLFAPGEDDRWLFDEAAQALSRLDGAPDGTAPLRLDDALGLLGTVAPAPRGRPVFGNGSLLFTRLGELDAVPHRVVCLLGLDDAHFPPRVRPLGGDLSEMLPSGQMPDDPRVRARQHLCDAILAARDRLIVVTQGANPRTNAELPPSVAILDLLEACAVPGPAGAWRPGTAEAAVVQHHWMQPYAWGNFASEGGRWPFSFDEDALRGATRLLSPPAPPPAPLWQADFGDGPAGPLDLDLLIRFFRNPAAELLRARTGLRPPWQTPLPEQLITTADPLLAWRLGDMVLHDLLAGVAPQDARAHALRAPQLPPGRFGAALVDKAGQDAAGIADSWTSLGCTPTPHEVILRIAGRALSGQADLDGGVLPVVRFGWMRASHLVDAWIRLLALSASADNDRPLVAALVGKGPLIGLQAPSAGVAADLLAQLVTVREAGLRRLVPLPPQTAHDLVRAVSSPTGHGAHGANAPRDAARSAWEGRWGDDSGEATDPAWRRFFPPATLDALLAMPAQAVDPAGMPAPSLIGSAHPTSRFEQLATWFWRPVLASMLTPPALREAVRATAAGGRP